jgi:hypothetical protein
MNPLQKHLKSLPKDLVKTLLEEFQNLHQQYFLGRWKPSQLDSGRFSEIIFRILEFKQKGSYTPIGTQINRQKIYNLVFNDPKMPDPLRFHILKLADLILDFRNKRNVAHPVQIDVNEMDSNFVVQSANWIISELIRIETRLSPAEAQNEIKRIIERKIPIIEEFGGRLKCLDKSLTIKEQVLIFCYQKYPRPVPFNDLFNWSEYRNKSRMRTEISKLNRDKLIDFTKNRVTLTKLGVLWVEKNIHFELKI